MHNDSIQGIIFDGNRTIRFRQPYTRSEKFFEILKHPKKQLGVKKPILTVKSYTTTYKALDPDFTTRSTANIPSSSKKRLIVQ